MPPHRRGGPRWAPLIAEAGLDLVGTRIDHGQRERWLALYALWLDHEAELRERLGDDTAEQLLREARSGPEVQRPSRRALQLTAERPVT
ncbi:hypothetical protein ACIQGZ_23810 [Streptomyces sp. NPDC092296]|uniref:hypothetical protein n=1 Tax=Streptomyces sp. NPDC092296 TaxID=3366012 RepID=UPI0038244926